MTPIALQFALHGSIALMSGLIGGLFFARAIKRKHGEVAWRVVHAGGCSALNRLVGALYSVGTLMTLLGCALLVYGLLHTALLT
jgi:hypothetical protein